MRTPARLYGLGDPGQLLRAGLGAQPGGSRPQPGSEPLGWDKGAPTRTSIRIVQIAPGLLPISIVPSTRESRVVTLLAPLIAFSIFVGEAGVTTRDVALPPGLPYDLVIPGLQELFAVTDSPVVLPLRVQIAPILIGDRERTY